MIDSAQYNTAWNFEKIRISRRKRNQKQNYFNPLVSGLNSQRNNIFIYLIFIFSWIRIQAKVPDPQHWLIYINHSILARKELAISVAPIYSIQLPSLLVDVADYAHTVVTNSQTHDFSRYQKVCKSFKTINGAPCSY